MATSSSPRSVALVGAYGPLLQHRCAVLARISSPRPLRRSRTRCRSSAEPDHEQPDGQAEHDQHGQPQRLCRTPDRLKAAPLAIAPGLPQVAQSSSRHCGHIKVADSIRQSMQRPSTVVPITCLMAGMVGRLAAPAGTFCPVRTGVVDNLEPRPVASWRKRSSVPRSEGNFSKITNGEPKCLPVRPARSLDPAAFGAALTGRGDAADHAGESHQAGTPRSLLTEPAPGAAGRHRHGASLYSSCQGLLRTRSIASRTFNLDPCARRSATRSSPSSACARA